MARQILSKLLQEKIVFQPEDRDGRRGFGFTAVGTIEPLLEGAVPGCLQSVVALTGTDRLQRRLTVVSKRWFEVGTKVA